MANFQLGDSEKVAYSLVELDAKSVAVPGLPTDVVSVTSDNTNLATVVPDATPTPGSVASGFIVGGTPVAGQPNTVNITATVTHADGTSLSVSDAIDIVGGAANSISLGLGAPVAQ